MLDVIAFKLAFAESYGVVPRVWSAPGRVNLIGEHTDYNDGFVLPLAINLRTFVAAAPRVDRRVMVRAAALESEASFDLDQPAASEPKQWLAYVEGVARVLEERGARLVGANMAIASDVPIGAGLSSSAALEISAGMAFSGLSNVGVGLLELALAGQIAEHTYAGTKCGLMDQLSVLFGRRGHALLIDCRTLEMTPTPLNIRDAVVVVCDTRVKHELSASAYNTRRAECERGVELLRQRLPGVQALRDVSLEDFQLYEKLLPEPIRQRCRHVVTENARTLRAVEALRAGDPEELGRLMLLSHESLRVDFEVSCPELDAAVGIAMGCEGVVGARMTGGGFGGSTVNLVRLDALEGFRETMRREYSAAFGFEPFVYVVEADDGAFEVS